MNCKHCDYPLWNLRTRQCPECGQAFAPSQFRFAINSVQFCCPHCGQDYYGTGANGHLVPRAFECVSCARRIDMDEMVLLPTTGVEERLTRADVNPWLDKDRRPLRRWWQTLLCGMSNPAWLLRATPIEDAPERGWGFALLTTFLFALVMMIPAVVIAIALAAIFGSGPGVFGMSLLATLGFGIGTLIFIGIWTVVAHLLLRIGGPTAGGMGRTSQAICFTCGPQALVFVPCIGPYLAGAGLIWWSITAGIALAAAQKVSGARAALAIAVFPALVAAAAIAGIVAMVIGSVRVSTSGVGGWGSTAPPSVATFAPAVADAVGSGDHPAHAAGWMLDGTLLPAQFVSPYSGTMPNAAMFMGIPLDRLMDVSDAARARIVGDAAAALPRPGAPHRVGDFVFALDTLPHAAADPGLWVVIEAWDTQFNPGGQGSFAALTVGGEVQPIPSGMLQQALDTQNQARAALGLAPLPHPQSIRAALPQIPGGP